MAKSPFVIPADIRRMLGPAPVLSTEDANRFEEMLTFVAQPYQPKNALEWFRVWDQTVARWNLERLTRDEIQVRESLRNKLVKKAEQARTRKAEEENKARELDRILARYEAGRGIPIDIEILSGLPLREAKQRLLSCLLRRPDVYRRVEHNGLTRDHFRDNSEWQEIFDLGRSGADIQAKVVQNPTGEIARLWELAGEMGGGAMLSLARQIVASVGAEDAAVVAAAREPTANQPVGLTELAAELDYASALREYVPLLLDFDKLKTSEQKRFDVVPPQIAFERDCLALQLHDVDSDPPLEVEFKEGPIVVEADQLPAISSTVPAPVRALPRPLSVELPSPDSDDEDSSKLEPARSQLPCINETPVGERSTAESPPAMLQATEGSSSLATPPAGAVPSDNTDTATKLPED